MDAVQESFKQQQALRGDADSATDYNAVIGRAGELTLERQLASATYDCVVIGGGIRIPPKSLLLFERLLNSVHKSAPEASIAFNTVPQDTADAASRWFKTE